MTELSGKVTSERKEVDERLESLEMSNNSSSDEGKPSNASTFTSLPLPTSEFHELGQDSKTKSKTRKAKEESLRLEKGLSAEGVSDSERLRCKRRPEDNLEVQGEASNEHLNGQSDHQNDDDVKLVKTSDGSGKSRLRKKTQPLLKPHLDDSYERLLRNGKTLSLSKNYEKVGAASSSAGANNFVSAAGNRRDTSDSVPAEKRVLTYQDAPAYLKFNPYITGGYRSMLTPRQCVRSLFWWTNETLNIWSHLMGWALFLCLSVHDAVSFLSLPTTHPWDGAIMAVLLVSFQACMLLSALYHVFCCCSESYYRRWLTADLFGVSLSLLAVYISGIYYAFSCVPFWLSFYLITVGAIFVSAVVLQILPVVHRTGSTTAKAFHGRLVVFGGWAAYGILPTLHWALLHGGMSSPIVALLLPRIFMMYGITAVAFFFYVLRLPEKLYPGLVNFIGSSHQLWHILIVLAFYHWHNTGLLFLQFRAKNTCLAEYAFLFPSVQDTVVLHQSHPDTPTAP